MQAKGIIVALAAVFVGAECFLPFGQPQDLRRSINYIQSDCAERVTPCWDLMLDGGFKGDGSFNLTNVVDNINQHCTSFQQASECLRPLLNNCSTSSQQFLENALAAGDFYCSERGRSLLGESRTSPCYSNSSLMDDVSEATDECITARVAAGLCLDQKSISNCSVTATVEQCGERLGQFIREFYAAVDQSEFDCSTFY